MVSVCMITYNHEKYIRQAIEGVLMQKINFSVELIIGEDCSTDATREICLEYKNKFPNVIKLLLPSHNLGAHENFFQTLSNSSGKYIALCEGDDYWTDPYKLQKQVNFLEKNPAFSLCFHNAIVKNLQNNTERKFNGKLNKNIFTIRDVILKSWFTPTASFVFRNNSLIYDKDWKNVNGDMLILYSASLLGPLFYMDEVMSIYNYCTPGSLSKNAMGNYMVLYRKKFNLLKNLDNTTHYRYFAYTFIKRIKMLGGIVFEKMKFYVM